MPRARIITDNPENASDLIRRLESKGYTVQIAHPGEVCEGAAELEIELEKLPSRDALAKAARLNQGKQATVFVASNCLDLPQAEPEEVPLGGQLLERAQAERNLKAEPDGEPAVPPAVVPLRIKAAGAAVQIRDGLRRFLSIGGGFLRQTGVRAGALLRDLEKGIEARSGSLIRNWRVLRERQSLIAQRRREAQVTRRQEVELQRSKRRLQEQEELRHQLARKRLAEEERERDRQLQEQLQRLQHAEEEERRQQARETQLERQRLDALKLAEERERVVRERAEQERQAEQIRLQRLQEAEQQRYERERIRLQELAAMAVLPEGDQSARAQETPVSEEGNAATDVLPELKAEESAVPPEPVLTYNLPERSRRSRWESDLNSPYHPAWSWAAAAAGAVTVAIMLLWTALGTSPSSVVRFTPVAPSSLLPVHTQIQQQLPFGPVKLTLPKAAPASVVPVKTPVVQERSAVPPSPAPILPKPSAEKPRASSSKTVDSADSDPDVVVRHFNVSAKVQTPAARQTATIKHYSDLN